MNMLAYLRSTPNPWSLADDESRCLLLRFGSTAYEWNGLGFTRSTRERSESFAKNI